MTTIQTVGRFSTGMEQLGPSAEKERIGRISTGMEQLSLESGAVGRFSTGMQRLGPSPQKDAVGRFSTGMEQDGSPNRRSSRMSGVVSSRRSEMTDATVQRIFDVEAPVDVAWHRVADLERWPEWAPHIRSAHLSTGGELGPTSRGAVSIKGLGRNTFQVSAWEPPVRWEWIGRFPGLRVYYDHRFEPRGPTSTRMEWLVTLRGPIAPLIRGVFARVYGRIVDRAIPRLQEWFRADSHTNR